MIADRAGEQDLVAGPHGARPKVRRRESAADAGGGDVHAVGLAVLDDLGVAADDRSPRRVAAAFAMARTSASRISVGRPASRTKVTTSACGAGAGDRQIVHRSVDGQFADGAAGKAQRLDDEAVGGDGQASAVDLHVGGIGQAARWNRRTEAERTDLRPGGGWPFRRRRAPSRSADRGSEFWASPWP